MKDKIFAYSSRTFDKEMGRLFTTLHSLLEIKFLMVLQSFIITNSYGDVRPEREIITVKKRYTIQLIHGSGL